MCSSRDVVHNQRTQRGKSPQCRLSIPSSYLVNGRSSSWRVCIWQVEALLESLLPLTCVSESDIISTIQCAGAWTDWPGIIRLYSYRASYEALTGHGNVSRPSDPHPRALSCGRTSCCLGPSHSSIHQIVHPPFRLGQTPFSVGCQISAVAKVASLAPRSGC